MERVALAVPEVKLGSPSGIGDGPDLSEIIEPIQSYLLSSCPESYIVNDAATTVTEYLDVLKCLAGTGVVSGYSPWVYVDCLDED